jgi:hypothetical protein
VAKGERPVLLKRVRNAGIFRLPREIRIHRLAMEAQAEDDPFTPRLLSYRRGMHTSLLHIEHLDGPPPKHLRELGDVGGLIARVEATTNRLLKARRTEIDRTTDFYLSGDCHGPRYNIASIASAYTRNNPPPFREFEDIVRECATSIEQNEAMLMKAEPVLSHLDHFLKNFIRSGGRLFLIDWGEGYIGRPGFDAGCFLMILLRSYDVYRFESEAKEFCRSYLTRTVGGPQSNVIAAINRVFLPRSLWYLLRPDIVSGFQASGKLEEWRTKFLLLGRFASGQFWRGDRLSGEVRGATD